jgi:hypothetical protein
MEDQMVHTKNKQEQQKRAQQSAQGLSSFLLKAKWF